jgi:hypothetical protein
MKNITLMSRPEIERAYARLQKIGSDIADEMIADGRGYELPTETRTKTDELSVRYNAYADLLFSVVSEIRYRQQYHGNLRPVKVTV